MISIIYLEHKGRFYWNDLPKVIHVLSEDKHDKSPTNILEFRVPITREADSTRSNLYWCIYTCVFVKLSSRDITRVEVRELFLHFVERLLWYVSDRNFFHQPTVSHPTSIFHVHHLHDNRVFT